MPGQLSKRSRAGFSATVHRSPSRSRFRWQVGRPSPISVGPPFFRDACQLHSALKWHHRPMPTGRQCQYFSAVPFAPPGHDAGDTRYKEDHSPHGMRRTPSRSRARPHLVHHLPGAACASRKDRGRSTSFAADCQDGWDRKWLCTPPDIQGERRYCPSAQQRWPISVPGRLHQGLPDFRTRIQDRL